MDDELSAFTLYSRAASDRVSTEAATSRADVIGALRTMLMMMMLMTVLKMYLSDTRHQVCAINIWQSFSRALQSRGDTSM